MVSIQVMPDIFLGFWPLKCSVDSFKISIAMYKCVFLDKLNPFTDKSKFKV